MDTKWKNTIKTLPKTIKKNKNLVIGVIFGVLCALLLLVLYPEIYAMRTTSTWGVGLIINVLLSVAVIMITKYILDYRYRDWEPMDEGFYSQWKSICRKQQKSLIIIAIIAVLATLLVYFLIRRYVLVYSGYYYYSTNLSTFYLMIATLALQFCLCEICITRFMRAKLDPLMSVMTKISQDKLAEAMELERESIEKAAKSERLKVDLISNVSHDLKTPLTSMVGYIELMKKEDLSDEVQDYVDVISNRAEKLKEMIESLFSIAKASSGNVKLNPENLSLNTLIDQILADMSSQIEKSDLQLVPILTAENTDLVTDNIHMYRICQNLIENALKYSAPGTRIFVKTSLERILGKENVCLEITNTAGYMMDFDKEDIVERFSRGDKSRTSDGNGLGLAIVSTYTSALGGAFDINIDCDQFKVMLSFPKDAEIKNSTEEGSK